MSSATGSAAPGLLAGPPEGGRVPDAAAWLLVAAALALLYLPTFWGLAGTIWASDEQGHGPIVLGLSAWLIWRQRAVLFGPGAAAPRPGLAWALLLAAGAAYALGRSQDILLLEVGSLIPMVAGSVLMLRGPRQLRAIAFALFFMLFMVPLPSSVVDALTQPMKMAVSQVATQLLFWFGYPVGRSGVIIHIGQYQLLVADACAGLHTLFTLEAIGLLYLNLVRSQSMARNVTLALLIVPISFIANVMRVIVLALITFYFGDAAGQGFMHGFAGMLLFVTALLLILLVDGVLAMLLRGRRRA
ncbi:exosortase B [Rubrivivax gelatinosus]|uniref:Exosortase B n=1 Tax=Rubrivivax gelatinosus TaxID=28068 RepID=A0A4R2M3M6_RUBGE|nr:exosortase B [Rubrivivax gelatinosus]TCP01122.1 exosortase B [Rubrivivax gelatinosus]